MKKNKYKIIVGFVVVYIVITTAFLIFYKKNKQVTKNEGVKNSIKSSKAEDKNETKKLMSSINKSKKKVNTTMLKGDSLYQKGHIGGALKDYEKELEKDPNNVNVHLKVALMYMGKKKNKKKAKYHLNRVLEINPNHPKNKIIKMWLNNLGS